MTQKYVAGFMIDSRDRVALVIKNRPTWQAGKLNGIGGHVEPGESAYTAMVREFAEETKVKHSDWTQFCTLCGVDFEVTFFVAFVEDMPYLQTATDEHIVIVPSVGVTVYNAIPNLTWLIPMAKSMRFDRAKSLQVTEQYGVV